MAFWRSFSESLRSGTRVLSVGWTPALCLPRTTPCRPRTMSSASVPKITIKGTSIQIPSGLYIGGQWVQGAGPTIDSINPAIEEHIATVQSASREDVDKAVTVARDVFETKWGNNMPASTRSNLLFEFASAIEKDTEELAMIESLDSGKPLEWCKFDIADGVATLRYFAGAADKIHGQTIETDDAQKSISVRKEPLGVVAQIIPWNYPILMMVWKIAPALAAGCSILFKPAENTPLSALRIFELFDKIEGYPKGCFNLLNGYGNVTGQAFAEHMDIDKIAFTGSTKVGKHLAKTAAESNLKRCTLELGGKSPQLVFEGADLKEAAKWCCFGVTENMGQSCTAGSRILVQESIYDEFMPLLLDAFKAVKVGDPMDSKTLMGAQVTKAHYERIMGYIKAAQADGATLSHGGVRHGDKGYFIEPTLFTDVSLDNVAGREEIFGAVGCVFKFKNEAEAIKIANDTPYGLAASVHSLDARLLRRVVRKLKAGTVWENSFVVPSYQVPFGGYKSSGWGRELGMQGLDAYLETKAVHQYYGDPLDWPIV